MTTTGDHELVGSARNTARYFAENPHVGWVALVLTLVAGAFGYARMPKAKDPLVEVRVAVASCAWPGAEAEKVEQLITRPIEQKLGESAAIEKLESISRTGVSIVYVTLRESITDRTKEWSDIAARLDAIRDLPAGAQPIRFQKDFGDVATLMLTIASPRVSDVELELRATALARAIRDARAGASGPRATLVLAFPPDAEPAVLDRLAGEARRYFEARPGITDARLVHKPGFLGLDVATKLDDDTLRGHLRDLASERLRMSELHPDVWPLVIVRDPKDTRARLAAAAADRYTYRELDRFSELAQRYLQRVPTVAKVARTGVVPEQIYLEYSQARLASYGIEPARLAQVLAARNITAPGGMLEVGGKNVTIDPSGALASTRELGDVVVGSSANGALVYLRDLVDISREYQSPARFLNVLTARDATGELASHRAITLAITMREGAQIAEFAAQVDRELAMIARLLPDDLIVRRTSDQPKQVEENVGLFMRSLYETVALVVLAALLGFWEWRTALLLALSIPITLAMTFAMMFAWGIDLQQVSIATLIIALGLLVDDPVVASDAIKHSIAAGWQPRLAAWLGPTKLAKAIVFATVTNIAAYLPFLTLGGDIGKFLYALPIVMTLSLIASRIVSMTFIPLLGALILRPRRRREPSAAERRARGFGRVYCAVVGWAIDHRVLAVVASLGFVAGGVVLATTTRISFFPKDESYLSYVEVWLPEDASLAATRAAADDARAALIAAAGEYGAVVDSVTTFVGGGGPRFWFSVQPELPQLNYAQLVVQLADKHDTAAFEPFLQDRLSRAISGARVDVRQLETGKPIGIPIAIRISGEDIQQLRSSAKQLADVLRATPGAARVRDDWGNDTFAVRLEVDPDRANLAGVTNLDVAASSAVAMNGTVVGQLRERDREIASPTSGGARSNTQCCGGTIDILLRLRADERSRLSDIQDLYVMSLIGTQKVPLGSVSRLGYSFQTEKIRRRNQFRTITVYAFPAAGTLASEVLAAARPGIAALEATLAPGYTLEIAGEQAEQDIAFGQFLSVTSLMLTAIFCALVVQLKSAVKPLIVFAALPYGAAAAVISLLVAGIPIGFMGILGLISLMGVIVSHIIVLFDFIEEGHERGAPMRETLLDAGLMRLRPVLVTVVATVLGLIPLLLHGGPLWVPLCVVQIGGLTFATVITLVLVPVLYAIFILDLRLIRWDARPAAAVVRTGATWGAR